MIENVKFTFRTASGTLIRKPITLEYVDGRIYFWDEARKKSPWGFKDEIKSMRGSKFHGYDEEGTYAKMMVWSVDDCQRNRFQIGFLKGENVYAMFDQPLRRHKYRAYSRAGVPSVVMPHQYDMADAGLTYHYQIFAAEMGCVDGDAVISVGYEVNYQVSPNFKDSSGLNIRFKKVKLSAFCEKFSWTTRLWYIKSHGDNGVKHTNRILNVLDKGVRPVVKLQLVSGQTLRLTEDHEVCTRGGVYIAAKDLIPGDGVVVNGYGRRQFNISCVVSVESDGEARVYDIVCADPHRNFAANGIYVHNCGKTLSAQMVMEESGVPHWYWAGPKTSLPNIKRELKMWGFPESIDVEFYTYEGLVRIVDDWDGSKPLPRGFIMDESSRCKNTTAQRSKACQKLADMIRENYGKDGYVIEMSGTPSPKTPVDWWSQCEIAWPGFLKEGGPKPMEERLAFMVQEQYDAGPFKKRIGWKDNERKCAICGKLFDEGPHDEYADPNEFHVFESSVNEVAYLYDRLKGLVIIKHKKDCLNLPDKRYRRIICKPTQSILRVAKALVDSAPNAITGMTRLRELSDGFQYRETQDGVTTCRHCEDGTVSEWLDTENEDTFADISMLTEDVASRLVKQTVPCPVCGGTREVPKIVRTTREVACPKDAALKMLLEENEEQGRLVVFAGFTGSVDRIVRLCLKQKWDVVRCDQGNFQIFAAKSDADDGVLITKEEPLDYWANFDHPRVVFVANPESGGMSLTLVEARMAVYWSNSWKPEYRVQSEDRIHRKGMDENLGCTIVDLIHLPSDERVINVLRSNRRLELMSMGELLADVSWETTADEEGTMQVMEAVP
jgi:hypothetical protein